MSVTKDKVPVTTREKIFYLVTARMVYINLSVRMCDYFFSR